MAQLCLMPESTDEIEGWRMLIKWFVLYCLVVFLLEIGWLRYLVKVCGIILTHRKEPTSLFLAQASSHSFFRGILSGKANAGIW